MEDLSKSLAMILPKSLYQKAQQALQELNTNLSIYSASLDEAVKIAQDLAAKDIQVLIVRGGTEFLLEDLKLPISIVSVPVTPLDVSKAIVRAQSLGQKVGVIAFPNLK